MSFKEWIIKKLLEKECKKMLEKLEGKKTHILSAVQIVLGVWLAAAASADPNLAFIPDVPGVLVSVIGALQVWTRSQVKPR